MNTSMMFRMDDTLQELVDFIDLEYTLTNNETLVISLLNRTARKLLVPRRLT